MKFLKTKLTDREVKVVVLSDIHFGSHAVDYKFLKRVKEYILENRARVLILGDIFHCITKTSKGSPHDQCKSPKEQVEEAKQWMWEFREQIDLVVKGNHDSRIEEETSIDIVENLCLKLGIEDKYIGWHGLIGYSINSTFYTFECFHGSGSGGTLGAVERNLTKYRRTNCDVMVVGHYHKKFVKELKEYEIDPFNKKIHSRKRMLVANGSCVNTEGYAEKMGLQENFVSQTVFSLEGDKRKRNIKVNTIE